MIRTSIQHKFLHQFSIIETFSDNIYIADYTEQTKNFPIKRSVEFFSPAPPLDISYFSTLNSNNISVDGIEFNNSSFVCANGQPKTQCESVFFPSVSNSNSWILFCELKYSSLPARNINNLKKAIKQLYKTRYYYIQNKIIDLNHNCYLIASLPLQSEPFVNFSVPQSMLIKLKRRKNIILRLQNKVEIIDNEIILV